MEPQFINMDPAEAQALDRQATEAERAREENLRKWREKKRGKILKKIEAFELDAAYGFESLFRVLNQINEDGCCTDTIAYVWNRRRPEILQKIAAVESALSAIELLMDEFKELGEEYL